MIVAYYCLWSWYIEQSRRHDGPHSFPVTAPTEFMSHMSQMSDVKFKCELSKNFNSITGNRIFFSHLLLRKKREEEVKIVAGGIVLMKRFALCL